MDAVRKKVLEFRESGAKVTEAAHGAGVVPSTIWRWRQSDPEFASAWEEATCQAREVFEEVLELCANKALDDPRYQTSLIFLLKNNRPERWADRHKLEHRVAGGVDLGLDLKKMSDEELRRLANAVGEPPPDWGNPNREDSEKAGVLEGG